METEDVSQEHFCEHDKLPKVHYIEIIEITITQQFLDPVELACLFKTPVPSTSFDVSPCLSAAAGSLHT